MSNKRYYNKMTPDMGDILIITVDKISEYGGVYCNCSEYPDQMFFIPPTEIAKRKVNVDKFFVPETFYPVIVLNKNENQKITDVSYSKVPEKDREDHLERYRIYQKIYKLGLEACDFCSADDNDCEQIFDLTVRSIFNKFSDNKDSTKTVQEFYINMLENPVLFFGDSKLDFQDDFIENIKKRIKITDVLLACEITLMCLQNEAVQKIKNVLKNDIDPKVQIRYIASPRYEILVSSSDKDNAKQLIDDTIKIIKKNCKEYGVEFVKSSEIIVLKEKNYSFS